MKVFEFRTRLIAPVVVNCCFVFLGSQSLHAQQGFSFPNFSSSTGIQTNGNTAVASNGTAQVLRITPAAQSQIGSAWYTTPLPLAKGFATTFRFQISGTTSFNADGFAFVIQNGSFCNGTSGASAIAPANPPEGCPSGLGGSIGYFGLTHSVAIEFDTFQNTGYSDVSNDELAVQSCGASANTADHSACNFGVVNLATASPTPIVVTDGQVHTAKISYSPPSNCGEIQCANLIVAIDGEQVLSAVFDIASLGLDASDHAYVGFTGATGAEGGGNDNHDILSWSFSPDTQTVTLGGPGTTTTLTFDTDTYKITGVNNQGGEQLTVTAFPVPKSSFPSLMGFSNETCVPYRDYSATAGVDTCVEFQATCLTAGGAACNFIYQLATSYDLPDDLPAIGGPDFLVAHGQPCALATGSTVQSIFLSYTVDRTDPTTRGGSLGPSCFVATYTPGATPITTGGVSVSGYFVGFQFPIKNPPFVNPWEELGQAFPPIPLIWQEFDASNTLIRNPKFFSFCGPSTPLVNCPANSVALKFVPIDCTTHAATGPAIRANALFNFVFFNPFNNTFIVSAIPRQSFDDTCQALQLVITGTGSPGVQSTQTAFLNFQ